MRVYIAGPITENPECEVQFTEAEKMLTEAGFETVNPLKVCSMLPNTFTHSEYMHVCFRLVDVCDCVYMLRGWHDSKGAHAEFHYAHALGKNIYYQSLKDVPSAEEKGNE